MSVYSKVIDIISGGLNELLWLAVIGMLSMLGLAGFTIYLIVRALL